jgi:hypothetical protein
VAAKSQQQIDDLEYLHRAAAAAKVDSRAVYGDYDPGRDRVAWSPDRRAMHEFAKNLFKTTGGPENPHLHDKGGILAVPKDHRGLILAGLPGSGKTTILRHPNLSEILRPDDYFSVNPDPYKYLYSHLGMVPSKDEIFKAMQQPWAVQNLINKGMDPEEVFYRLSHMDDSHFTPGDLTPFIHEEASDTNKAVRDELMRQGYNLAFDGTLPNEDKAQTLLSALRNEGYSDSTGLLVNASFDPARGRAIGRYQNGDDAYLAGRPDEDWAPLAHLLGESSVMPGTSGVSHGGRYVPAAFAEQNRSTKNGKSGSEDGLLSIQPSLQSSLIVDADRDMRGGAVPLLEGGHGPAFQQAVASGGVEYDPSRHKGLRLGRFFMADAEDKYVGSVLHIMLDYERGKFDFDTLVGLLANRARSLKENHTEPDRGPWNENVGIDDVWRIIDNAESRGSLTSEEAEIVREEVDAALS